MIKKMLVGVSAFEPQVLRHCGWAVSSVELPVAGERFTRVSTSAGHLLTHTGNTGGTRSAPQHRGRHSAPQPARAGNTGDRHSAPQPARAGNTGGTRAPLHPARAGNTGGVHNEKRFEILEISEPTLSR